MSRDHDSSEDVRLDSLTESLLTQAYLSTRVGAQDTWCCCGQNDCEMLKKNRAILSELESQAQLAASIGHALLKQHEASNKESEIRQHEMFLTISKLEMKASKLEMQNSKVLEENKQSLKALQDLNCNLSFTENRVKVLQHELDATHEELSHISAHVTRTDVLESQLTLFEDEQQQLQHTLTTSRAKEKSAITRWKKAERAIVDLEQQLEKIELEYIHEKDRSQKILHKLTERKPKDPDREPAPFIWMDSVGFGQFMKDILTENGLLVTGVQELRDMLAAAQEEIKLLREKLDIVEPVHQEIHMNLKSPLSIDFGCTSPGTVRTIIHHHYHGASDKTQSGLKHCGSLVKESIDTLSGDWNQDPRLSKDLRRNPADKLLNRWWTATKQSTLDSQPTSTTRSILRDGSVFDNFESSSRASLPTTDDSIGVMINTKLAAQGSDMSSSMPPFPFLDTSDDEHRGPVNTMRLRNALHKSLRRTVSHESVWSVVGRFHPEPTRSSQNRTKIKGFVACSPTFKNKLTFQDPQASITPMIALRDSDRPRVNSAYHHLLGVHQKSSSVLGHSSSPKDCNYRSGGGWPWKWRGFSKECANHQKLTTGPSNGYMEIGSLQETLMN